MAESKYVKALSAFLGVGSTSLSLFVPKFFHNYVIYSLMIISTVYFLASLKFGNKRIVNPSAEPSKRKKVNEEAPLVMYYSLGVIISGILMLNI